MTPDASVPIEDGPRVDDPEGYARTEIQRRLTAIGCTSISDETTIVHGDKLRLTIQYVGRDESGHLTQSKGLFEARPGELMATIELRIERLMRAQERRFVLAEGIAPVVPGLDMPLSHLEISLPYARRLRIDHGTSAQDALRKAIVDRLTEGGPVSKSLVPNQPAFCAHRINHREQLGEGVWLRGENLVIANTTLPQQIAIALTGRPVTAVCHHPVLGDTETVRGLEMTNIDGTHGKRTATVHLNLGWIRGNEI